MADNSSTPTDKVEVGAKQNILDKNGITDFTSIEVELIQKPTNSTSPKRKRSSAKQKWSNIRESISKSEAISEDTKRFIEAYRSLDDLTVIPTQIHLWTHQDAKSITLIIALPAVVTALWLAIPLNPWGYEKWNEQNIGMYAIYASVYAIFQSLSFTQFFNSIMPLSKLHQLAIAIFVATSVIVIAWVSGLVVGSFFFENCLLAAVAWDSFAALGIGFSFIWVTVVLFRMINKASRETHNVVQSAKSYKALYEHTSKNISKAEHFHGQLHDVVSAFSRHIHEKVVDHHVAEAKKHEAKLIEIDKGNKEEEASVEENDKNILELSTKVRVEIAQKLEKISDDFTMQKKWQLGMTMLVIFICGVTYWALTVFIAWFASASHDPITKGYQTIVYHSIIILFEWLGCLCADIVDVAQITTVTPGVLTGEHNRRFDDFKFYRLSTRVMFYFSFVRRAFYIPLFVQIDNWMEYLSMSIVSMAFVIGFQILLRSPRYYKFMEWYVGNCWPLVPYRSYRTCLDQACLYNYFDFINIFSGVLQFLVAYVFCTMTYNGSSFNHYFKEFQWDTILYVVVWSILQCIYCLIISQYESKVPRKFSQRIPKPLVEGATKLEYDEGEEKSYVTDPLDVLSHVYKSGDTILYSMVIIAIHVSQNPYFAFTLHNLSANPCTDLVNTTATGTAGTNIEAV
eukprot:g989.t1